MDLYIQIGVILLLLTALSIFIYMFTLPSNEFINGTREETTKAQERIEDLRISDSMYDYLGKGKIAKGEELIALIDEAKTNKLGFIVGARPGFFTMFGKDLGYGTGPTSSYNNYSYSGTYPSGSETTISRKRSICLTGLFVDQCMPQIDTVNHSNTFNRQSSGPGFSHTASSNTIRLLVRPPTMTSREARQQGLVYEDSKDLYLANVPNLEVYYKNDLAEVGAYRNINTNQEYKTYRILSSSSELVGFIAVPTNTDFNDFDVFLSRIDEVLVTGGM